jgi:hypothetical protein
MKLNPVNINLGKRLPRPQLGINMWSQGARAKVIRQVVDAYGNVDNQTFFFNFDGVIQPLRPEEIKVKEEAQWSWDWYWFHTLQNVQLTTNDRVFYKGIEYKIMAVKDYSDYGHIEYHCIKDWQNDAD